MMKKKKIENSSKRIFFFFSHILGMTEIGNMYLILYCHGNTF